MKKIKRFVPLLILPVIALVFLIEPVLAAEALPNPLGITNPDDLIARIIKTFLGVVGAIALLLFMWGGFTMMTSGGSPERLKKGRDSLFWAIMGLIIIFGSYAITEAVFKILSGVSIA